MFLPTKNIRTEPEHIHVHSELCNRQSHIFDLADVNFRPKWVKF